MKTLIWAQVVVLAALLSERAQAVEPETPPEIAWTRQLGTGSDDVAYSVAVDGAGNVFISGWTGGSLGVPNAGGSDAFIAKYSASGALLWTRQLGTGSYDVAYSVAVDSAGNAFVSGITGGSLGGPNAGNDDAFIAKYSASGGLLWTRQLGTSSRDLAFSVAVDGAGNAFISGITGGSLGGPHAGSWDAFLAKYSPAGALLWTRQLGTSPDNYANSVAVDEWGNAFISGWTAGSLGGSSAGDHDAFIAKYSASGALLWIRQLGTSGPDRAMSVAVDGEGNAFIGGHTLGSLGGPSAGNEDAFITKYSASGALLWTRQLGTRTSDSALSVAVDAAGNAFISGYTIGTIRGPNLGGNGDDAFIAKYSAAGALLWTRQFGTSTEDDAFSVAVDGAGNAFISGWTGGSMGGPNAGSHDAFLIKYSVQLDVIDPNSSTGAGLIAAGSVVNAPDLLGAASLSRQGLTADGVTRVVLRMSVSGSGTTQFTLQDENGGNVDVGTLSELGWVQQTTTLSVPAVQLANDSWMTFAVLKSPMDFARDSGDYDKTSRPIFLSAIFTPLGGPAQPSVTRQISLHRPPVLLLHGLWSDATTWQLPIETDSRFTVHPHDYGHVYYGSNAAKFSQNMGMVRSAIAAAVQKARSQGIAATQADVVGHSMGGLLSRLYVSKYAGAPYSRNDNFLAGDIHKLITVDTPHQGSPLATVLMGPVIQLTTLKTMIDLFMGCVNCGAVSDLRPDSAVFLNLSAASVPAHAIVGIGGRAAFNAGLQALPARNRPFWSLLAFLLQAGLFGNEEHDLIVAQTSQQGLLTSPAFTPISFVSFSNCKSGIHFHGVTCDDRVNERVINLLNARINNNVEFANEFPAFAGGSAQFAPPVMPPVVAGIVITSPSAGTQYSPSDGIIVNVQATKGFVPQRVLVLSSHDGRLIEQPPFETTLAIPTNALGPVTLRAYAYDANGALAESDPVVVQVSTTATLTGLITSPQPVSLFNFAPNIGVTVTGTYSDGVERNVTSPSFGTTYSTLDPNIATVDANGKVTSVSVGTTQLTATIGDLSASAAVVVVSMPRSGDINGDNVVNVDDLLAVINAWGACPLNAVCPADIAPPPTGNGIVNVDDLLMIINNWG